MEGETYGLARVLSDAVQHDFSTSLKGEVPAAARRPLWHLAGVWTTLAANFSFLFLGVALYSAGYSLEAAIGVTVLGCSLYIAYALPASYLGSRTGQTHALLTRSIFGGLGSCVVSVLLIVAPIGWVGINAGLLAQTWDSLFAWNRSELMTVSLGAVMVVSSLLGFVGISAFARYLVAPLMILWAAYFVARALFLDLGSLQPQSPIAGLPFWAAVGTVIGFATWGNEPDIWRYGKPRFLWPLPAFIFAYLWFGVFVMGGWIMACLSRSAEFGVQVRFATDYSLFGAGWLTWFFATIGLFALNGGNYYESINAVQNLLGGWTRWKRPLTCLLLAPCGAGAAYLVNFVLPEGWPAVAGLLAITVPSATIIMAVDQFLLPRLVGAMRPVSPIPAWREVGVANWPGLIALATAVTYGVYAGALLPSTAAADSYWGPVPVVVWTIAGVVYLLLAAAVNAIAPSMLSATMGRKRLPPR